MPPGLHGNPGSVPVYGTCGHRYQAGIGFAAGTAPSTPCACGMFAIGVCRGCDKPLCGTHGAMFGARFLCHDCYVEAHEEAEQAAHRERDRQRADSARRYEQWLERVRDDLAGMADETERLVRLVSATVNPYKLGGQTHIRADRVALAAVMPHLFDKPADLLVSPPWDHQMVHEWFLERAQSHAPTHPGMRVDERTFWGSTRVRYRPGWGFAEGGAGPARARYDTTTYPFVAILTDGRRYPSNLGFNALALRQMASVVGVRSLPPIPTAAG